MYCRILIAFARNIDRFNYKKITKERKKNKRQNYNRFIMYLDYSRD